MSPETPPGFPRLEKETRPWHCKWDVDGCTRKKPCNHCRGRRSRTSGRTKQRFAVKGVEDQFDVDFGDFRGQRAHEENMRGPIRIEVKSGAQVGPCSTRFRLNEEQSEAARPIGDMRPFVSILMPDGWGKDGIVQHRLSDWRKIIEALLS